MYARTSATRERRCYSRRGAAGRRWGSRDWASARPPEAAKGGLSAWAGRSIEEPQRPVDEFLTAHVGLKRVDVIWRAAGLPAGSNLADAGPRSLDEVILPRPRAGEPAAGSEAVRGQAAPPRRARVDGQPVRRRSLTQLDAGSPGSCGVGSAAADRARGPAVTGGPPAAGNDLDSAEEDAAAHKEEWELARLEEWIRAAEDPPAH